MLIILPGGATVEIPDLESSGVDDGGEIRLHTVLALSRLIEFWRNKPNLAGLLSSYTDAVQALEGVIWDVLVLRTPDYASDAQLDVLGKIVGEPREGRPDPAFRARIKARILINSSFGRPSDVIKVLRAIDSATFRLIELSTAGFLVSYTVPPTALVAAQLADIIAQTRAAGVAATLILPTRANAARYGTARDATVNAHAYGTARDASVGGAYGHIGKA